MIRGMRALSGPFRLLSGAAFVAAVGAGCAGFFPTDVDPGPGDGRPRSVADRVPLPSCGVERATTQTGPWNVDARVCFAAAYRSRSPAEFVTTRPSVEGDPVRTVFRVLGPGSAEVFFDSTGDAWSSGGWEHATCPVLVIIESARPGPDFTIDERCSTERIE